MFMYPTVTFQIKARGCKTQAWLVCCHNEMFLMGQNESWQPVWIVHLPVYMLLNCYEESQERKRSIYHPSLAALRRALCLLFSSLTAEVKVVNVVWTCNVLGDCNPVYSTGTKSVWRGVNRLTGVVCVSPQGSASAWVWWHLSLRQPALHSHPEREEEWNMRAIMQDAPNRWSRCRPRRNLTNPNNWYFCKERSSAFLLWMINGTAVQLQGSLSSPSLLFILERCQQKLHSPSKKIKMKMADEKYERTYGCFCIQIISKTNVTA